jgi:hypothetical protein
VCVWEGWTMYVNCVDNPGLPDGGKAPRPLRQKQRLLEDLSWPQFFLLRPHSWPHMWTRFFLFLKKRIGVIMHSISITICFYFHYNLLLFPLQSAFYFHYNLHSISITIWFYFHYNLHSISITICTVGFKRNNHSIRKRNFFKSVDTLFFQRRRFLLCFAPIFAHLFSFTNYPKYQ